MKRYSSNKGLAELWFIPNMGYRLVFRNLHKKNTFSNLKYRVICRQEFEDPETSLVTTHDHIIIEGDEFFIFHGMDHIFLSFELDNDSDEELILVPLNTDNANEIYQPDSLILEYSATLENYFNFDIKIMKRFEFNSNLLDEFYSDFNKSKKEQKISLKKFQTYSVN